MELTLAAAIEAAARAASGADEARSAIWDRLRDTVRTALYTASIGLGYPGQTADEDRAFRAVATLIQRAKDESIALERRLRERPQASDDPSVGGPRYVARCSCKIEAIAEEAMQLRGRAATRVEIELCELIERLARSHPYCFGYSPVRIEEKKP